VLRLLTRCSRLLLRRVKVFEAAIEVSRLLSRCDAAIEVSRPLSRCSRPPSKW
jgi:hypothetical protein